MKKRLGWRAPGGALCIFLILKKLLERRRLSAVLPASQRELCLRKFQSAEVRLNTMETQNEIALYTEYRCNKMEIHLFSLQMSRGFLKATEQIRQEWELGKERRKAA